MRPRLAISALLCLLTAQAGCAADASDADPPRITLVPAAAADATGDADQSWQWTADCRVGPRTSTGCEVAGPHLGVTQLAGNAWNLGGTESTSGSIAMSARTAGGIDITGDLSAAPPCTDPTCIAPEANTWVRGYPSVLYGIDQCNAATSPPQSPDLQLPVQVGAIPPNLVGTTAYRSDASQITYTVAYDLWLSPTDTTTPCQGNGTLEVMVWTDHDAESLLPDSMRASNATIPFAVDGVAQSGEGAWAVYVSNVHGDGDTAPWGGTVWLVLDGARRVERGAVSVDLSAALAAVGGLLRDGYGWPDFARSHWLDTIAFGIEYGPEDGDIFGAGPIDFGFELTEYCLAVGATVADADC